MDRVHHDFYDLILHQIGDLLSEIVDQARVRDIPILDLLEILDLIMDYLFQRMVLELPPFVDYHPGPF